VACTVLYSEAIIVRTKAQLRKNQKTLHIVQCCAESIAPRSLRNYILLTLVACTVLYSEIHYRSHKGTIEKNQKNREHHTYVQCCAEKHRNSELQKLDLFNLAVCRILFSETITVCTQAHWEKQRTLYMCGVVQKHRTSGPQKLHLINPDGVHGLIF